MTGACKRARMLVRAGRKKKRSAKLDQVTNARLAEGWMFSGRLFPRLKGG